MAVSLRSPIIDDAPRLLDHLQISHAESYRNLNQPAQYWHSFSVDQEVKVLSDFELAADKFMIVAVHAEKIVGGLGFFGGTSDFLKHSGRIGISLQRSYFGLGLGTGLMRAALELAAI